MSAPGVFDDAAAGDNRITTTDAAHIRWGVIGCGWVARDYVAPGIARAANSRLVALYDLDARAMERLVGTVRTNVPTDSPFDPAAVRRHTDLAEFLRSPDLDAVYIATPNDSHRTLTEAAARTGKHVLCEKPMATSFVDAAAMVEACRAHGVIYATAFDQRFHARHQALRELIANDELGTITHARIHYACWTPGDWFPPTDDGTHDNWRIDPRRAGGGAFIDLAPHGLDLTQYLLGDKLEHVECVFQRRVFDYAVDDGAALVGRFSSGALLSMNVAYNCPDNFPRRTLEIIGTQAMATARDTMGQTPGGSLRITSAAGDDREIEIDPATDISPFERQVASFADALLTNTPFGFPPQRDLHTMRVLEAAQAKALRIDSKHPASLPSLDADIAEWFAARGGDDANLLVNAVLRKYVKLHTEAPFRD